MVSRSFIIQDKDVKVMGVSKYWTGNFWTDVAITIVYFVATVLVTGLAVYFGMRATMRGL